MTRYFAGRHTLEQYSQKLADGRTMVHVDVVEYWQDIDQGGTARCKDPGKIIVRKKIGLSQRDYQTLTASIGGSIGIEAIAKIKSGLEAQIGREICWDVEYEVTREFTFTPPECGRRTETIYQLVREYDITIETSSRWSGFRTIRRTLREYSGKYDAYPDISLYDPLCPCKPPPENINLHSGILNWNMGRIALRTSYHFGPRGLVAHMGDNPLILKIDFLKALPRHYSVPVAALPKYVPFLAADGNSEIEAQHIMANVSEYSERIGTREFVPTVLEERGPEAEPA